MYRSRRWSWAEVVVLLWFAALAGLWLFRGLPFFVPMIGVIVSLVTFVVYAADKVRAGGPRRRISEKTLHLFELSGGWPGALIAQQWFRHKTQKTRFQAIFWSIAALHWCAAIAWALW